MCVIFYYIVILYLVFSKFFIYVYQNLKTKQKKSFHTNVRCIKKRSVKMCSFKFNGEIKSSNEDQKFNIKMKEEQTYV